MRSFTCSLLVRGMLFRVSGLYYYRIIVRYVINNKRMMKRSNKNDECACEM